MFGFGNKTEYQLVVEFNDDSPENSNASLTWNYCWMTNLKLEK